ncbi:hypothetical protein [uncultured Alistipes sp.]|uniref:hypothetical protein n=1 Tax=uncultured Alistipes sp. TaxID=538949 RepID=UPI00262B6009|nr:hypothetical protein [uncultured Alistipes sp.]
MEEALHHKPDKPDNGNRRAPDQGAQHGSVDTKNFFRAQGVRKQNRKHESTPYTHEHEDPVRILFPQIPVVQNVFELLFQHLRLLADVVLLLCDEQRTGGILFPPGGRRTSVRRNDLPYIVYRRVTHSVAFVA